MKYTGARILVESLINQGVDTIFGYPGGAVLDIYDELYRQKKRIRHILVSHEQHAAHAADGYARSSGKTGVCLATSGPGATNLITGIATAYMDSIPLVAITGNVPTGLLGKDSFQEVDIAGISMPVVKHNWIVKDINDLEEIITEAFIIARLGRPGPVLIDIPRNICAQKTEWKSAKKPSLPSVSRRLAKRGERLIVKDDEISAAEKLLLSAKRPMIYAGGGIISSGAGDELRRFAERLNAPVALSLMGIGAVPSGYKLCTGLIGMHGTTASNKAAQKTDLLIAIGARFSDRVTGKSDMFAKTAKILHFDIDPAEINKNIGTTAWVTGDIKDILAKLLKILPPVINNDWNGEIEKWKKATPQTYITGSSSEKKGLHPRFIIEESAKRLGPDAIAVTDVGQHQIWAAQFYPAAKPKSFITPGGLGTMGFGLGAACGVKTANPKKPVILFTGDGGFRMSSGEMNTLVSQKIPILIIVFNNGVLGMVRQWQDFFYNGRHYETDLNKGPDFVKLAEAYGISGRAASDSESIVKALTMAKSELDRGRAFLIDAKINSDEKVLPMVPSGKPIDEQII